MHVGRESVGGHGSLSEAASTVADASPHSRGLWIVDLAMKSTPRRRRARTRSIGGCLACASFAYACAGSVLVIGDDTRDATSEDGSTQPWQDAGVAVDATPTPCASFSGTCVTADVSCQAVEARGTCANHDERCCTEACPHVEPPPSSACLGTTPIAKYTATGCIFAYACAPVDCVAAGGSCVLASASCPSGHTGDPSSYACGLEAVGPKCCLP